MSSALKKLQTFGQAHVLKYIEELSEVESKALYAQIESLDLDLVREAHKFATQPLSADKDSISLLPETCVFSASSTSTQEMEWRNHGLFQIAAGKVCAILLAGGQGTRLGFSGPKGCFVPPLNSSKPIFQLLIERLKKVKSLASNAVHSSLPCSLPLYILTSDTNDVETRSFFESNSYFGLDRQDVFFFMQGMLPSVIKSDGKLMMQSKWELAMNPDGNGGLFSALDKSGALSDMQRRGVEYCHVMAIDNPQNLPGDPVFMGLCALKQVECGNLAVSKKHVKERVGVCALRNSKFHVVEYTDTELLDNADSFQLANICNHFFSVQFLQEKVLSGMKACHHAAEKVIPTVEDPKSKGIKLELFIFDAFPLASSYLALKADRNMNFSPIKNSEGDDSPLSCLDIISSLHETWLKKAGAILQGEGSCEVSALVSLDGKGLDRLVSGVRLQKPLLIESENGLCTNLDEFGACEYRLQLDMSFSSSKVNRYLVVRKRKVVVSENKQDAPNSVMDVLKNIDLATTTPVDALFLLEKLKSQTTI